MSGMCGTIADNAFDYLVERILARSCTPVIGAGISVGATLDGEPWNGHKVAIMVERVLKETLDRRRRRLPPALHKPCRNCQTGKFRSFLPCHLLSVTALEEPCHFCDLRQMLERCQLGAVCEAFVWERGQKDEATFKELVELLKIPSFARLQPTPAHYYLAFLAREGLLGEFITTNYDCCLEQAYSSTFSDASPADVIASLNDYTENAGLSHRGWPGEDTPHRIKVFKINGCAKRVAGANDDKEAKTILLTEVQLQDWRHRQWAADLFRMKFRSTSLCFVGFGSDEPQILHTVQQVLEEYGHDPADSKTFNQRSLFAYPNAPVVTLYTPPSFPQRQVAHGYAQWRGLEGAEGERLFIGRDGLNQALNESGTGPLEADELWPKVYQHVLRKLVALALRHAAAKENAAFTAVVPQAAKLLRKLGQSWDRQRDMAQTPQSGEHALLMSTESLADSFSPRHNTFPPMPRLIALMSFIKQGSKHSQPIYTAVNDHRSLAAELVFLTALLCAIAERMGMPEGPSIKTTGDLAYFELSQGAGREVLRLYASGGHGGGNQMKEVATPDHCAFGLELLLGAAGSHAPPLVYRRVVKDKEDQRIPLDVVRLCWRHLFPPDRPAVASVHELAPRLLDAMRHPTKYLRRAEPSIHRRHYLTRIGETT